MTVFDPGSGETPMEWLLRTQGESTQVFEWDEENFVPATPKEMRDGMRSAMAEAREKGWIPKEDPGCQCLVCRSFRGWLSE